MTHNDRNAEPERQFAIPKAINILLQWDISSRVSLLERRPAPKSDTTLKILPKNIGYMALMAANAPDAARAAIRDPAWFHLVNEKRCLKDERMGLLQMA